MLSLPETPIELTVERLGQLGEGVASWQGRTVFVPGAFPGDCRARPPGAAGQGAPRTALAGGDTGRIGARLPVPSVRTVAGVTGWSWPSPLSGRRSRRSSSRRWSTWATCPGIDFTVRPLLVAPKDFGYRRRAVLHFAKGALAYFGRRSHERVPCVRVRCAHACARAAARGSWAAAQAAAPRTRRRCICWPRGSKAAFAVMLTAQVTARHVEATEAAVRALRLEGAVLVPKEGSPRLVGKPALRSLSPLRPEVPLYLRPDSFAQAHAEANVGLVTSALYELAPKETDSVLELYSGNGNFTFPLAATAALGAGRGVLPRGRGAGPAQRSGGWGGQRALHPGRRSQGLRGAQGRGPAVRPVPRGPASGRGAGTRTPGISTGREEGGVRGV